MTPILAFTIVMLALIVGLAAAITLAVFLRRHILEALDQRRSAAGAVPARAVVSRYEVEQRKVDASVAGRDTVQITRIPIEDPEHTPRHAAPDEPEDRTYLLAKLDRAGYPADRIAREAGR